jgi:hypothetical protein
MQFASSGERTSIPARATLRQDCDEPHPEADKLLIRPTRQPGPVSAARTDKSHSGHHQLGRSVFGSRLCRWHQSQTTRRETGGIRLTISFRSPLTTTPTCMRTAASAPKPAAVASKPAPTYWAVSADASGARGAAGGRSFGVTSCLSTMSHTAQERRLRAS